MSLLLKRNYVVHGLNVRSAIDFVATTVQAGEANAPVVDFDLPQHFTGRTNQGQGETLLRTSWCEILQDKQPVFDDFSGDQTYTMSYPLHGFSFEVRTTAGHVHIQPISQNEQWIHMLPVMARGAVLTFACRLLGYPALHANTVRINEELVAFAGESGAGKTLSSSLTLLAGAELVSDDVTVVNESALVHPGLLEVRLRVDDQLGQVVATLLTKLPGVSSDQTPDERMAFRFDRTLRPTPALLTRVILPCLDPETDRFVLDTVPPPQAIMGLLKANRLVGWVDQANQRSDFAFAAFLADRVPIQRLRMPVIAANHKSVVRAAHQLCDLLAVPLLL